MKMFPIPAFPPGNRKPLFKKSIKPILAIFAITIGIFCQSQSSFKPLAPPVQNDSPVDLRPPAPRNVASVPLSSRQVKIFWARDTGSDFFCIYRAPSAGNRYDSISQTADTSFIDTGLESGTKYLYRVKAGNQHGLSDFSNIGSAITEIDKPSILSAELIRTDSIRITWNRINGAKSYKIYRVDSSFESTATVGSFLVNETPDTHWVDNIPVVKAVYNYVVEAVDFDFHSKFSDSASIAVRSGWTSLGPPGFSPGQAINLNLSVDNGVPIVSFIDLDFSKRISVMKWDGATWGFLGERGVSDGVVDYVSLSVENGIPSVAYCDYSQTYKASVKRFSQGAWIATGQLGFSAGAVDYPCISVSNGTPFVAYVDYQPNGTKKATVCRFDGTTWNPLAGPGICSNRLNSLVSLKLSGDVPFMAGVSDFSELNRAQVRRFAGTSWELFGDSVISLAGAVNPALALENGTAYVSFTDETNSNRITVVKSGGNGWETIGSPGMSVASAGFSSIAVENGIVYVAYIEINSNEPSYRISVRRHRNNIWEYLGSPGNSRGLLYAGIPYPLCPTISLFIRNGKVYLAFSDQSSDFKASVFQFEEE